MNKVILLGNVGRDCDFRQFDNGGAVASTSLATTERWKKDGELQEKTEWHNIVFSNKSAEVAHEHVKKGSSILISGSLRTRKYTDANNVERFITEVFVREWEFAGAKKDGNNGGSS